MGININLLNFLASELEALAEPLTAVVRDTAPPHELILFLDRMGWRVPDLDASGASEITATLEGVLTAVEGVQDGLDVESILAFSGMLQDLGDAVRQVSHLGDGLGVLFDVDEDRRAVLAAALGEDVFHELVTSYLRRRWPVAANLLLVSGVLRFERITALYTGGGTDGLLLRSAGLRERLRSAGLLDLLQAPASALSAVYLPDGLSGDLEAQAFNFLLFTRLRGLIHALGGELIIGPHQPSVAQLEDPSIERSFRRTTLELPLPDPDGAIVHPVLQLAIEALGNGVTGELGASGPGFEVALYGSADLSTALGDWVVELTLPSIDNFFIGPSGFSGTATGPVESELRVARSDSAVRIVIGSDDGGRLELGPLELSGWVRAETGETDFGFGLALTGSKVVVGGGDCDGFLASVIPGVGVEGEFDLGLEWSKVGGVRLAGAVGLEVVIPINRTIAGVLDVRSVVLELDVGDEAAELGLGVTASFELGPIAASVEGIGLNTRLESREDQDGDLGPFDLSLAFRHPGSLGLSLDTGAVTAAGYLGFDPDGEQYSGMLEVSFAKLSLTAIGLITTKLPSGADGWSFLILISARFTPIPVGFGFFLEAVGGIFGYNRSVDTDVLQAGIKDHTLDSILFPEDPIADAAEIISDLEAVFPPTEGQYVFGPMAKLIWPNPGLIDFDLAIVIEAPDPFRVVILGQIAAALPDEANALVKLNVDVLGVLDLDEGVFSILASVYESQIAGLSLNGDMAMRVSWLGTPTFAFSVGGFHPRYDPPAEFPQLERLAVAPDSDNPHIRLESYFAVTSNSAQFGAALSVYAEVVKCSVEGGFSFNALVIFSPFHFEVDFTFGVTVKAGKVTLAGIDLFLLVAGPEPWEIDGKATFKILGIKITAQVQLTIPKNATAPEAEPIDVLALLETALAEVNNWTSLPPTSDDPGVRFTDRLAVDDLIVHPAGGLEFRQTVAPLGIELDEYAGRPIDGLRLFDLEVTDLGGESVDSSELSTVEDWFATGQYFSMDEEEKLESPDYERFAAGFSVGEDLVALDAGLAQETEYAYEEILYEGDRRMELGVRGLTDGMLDHFAASSASAVARAAGPGASRFAGASGNSSAVSVSDVTWASASADDLSAVSGSEAVTYVEAARRKRAADGDLVVVPTCELTG